MKDEERHDSKQGMIEGLKGKSEVEEEEDEGKGPWISLHSH